MGLGSFTSKMLVSITKTTLQFNKTLDVLIERFKDGCPTTQELKSLITQKNQINGALVQIEQKIATLNKIAATSATVLTGVKAGVTLIKQLPIPTSFPPGVGIPVSIINMFSDALDKLGTIIDKEDASLSSIPDALAAISKDVGTVITKLKELDIVLNQCLEEDPNITQMDINSIVATTDNFVGVMTNEELNALLNTPPGLLYGDYYLRLNYLSVSQATLNAYNADVAAGEGVLSNALSIATATTGRSFDKKQVTAQNKTSVPPPGEYFLAGSPIEMLYGDESFSSSNIILVDEMKWTIDTKDLIFPPPPPIVDPMKEIMKQSQIAILMAIYGADAEEADELYDLAWDLSQGEGPNKSQYSETVRRAFDNSRTVLEQAVADEAYEWVDGDRILHATIKKLFLGNIPKDQQDVRVSQIIRRARTQRDKANSIGGSYNSETKRWANDGYAFESAGLYIYSERLASTAENNFNAATLGAFESLRPEMKKRKRLWQAVYDVANAISLTDPKVSFTDPLKDYFISKDIGYNTPFINGLPISGGGNLLITRAELENIWDLEVIYSQTFLEDNWDTSIDPWTTANGVNHLNVKSYAKTQLFIKLKNTLGNDWFNSQALATSELDFWYRDGNPNSNSSYYNDPNYYIPPQGSPLSFPTKNDLWFFEFGRNGLPIPTGS